MYLPRIVPATDLSPHLQQLFHEAQSHLHNCQEALFTPSAFLKMLKMKDHDSVELLTTTNEDHDFIIREPDADCEDTLDGDGLDLIIVPGLVFNEMCNRVGRGKGFYDNYIELHRAWSQTANKPSPLLGMPICFR